MFFRSSQKVGGSKGSSDQSGERLNTYLVT